MTEQFDRNGRTFLRRQRWFLRSYKGSTHKCWFINLVRIVMTVRYIFVQFFKYGSTVCTVLQLIDLHERTGNIIFNLLYVIKHIFWHRLFNLKYFLSRNR
jgi:hypothetical protein